MLCQEKNSFITVLLVSSPRFVTSVEDKMNIWMSDKQQTGSMQKGDDLKMVQNKERRWVVRGCWGMWVDGLGQFPPLCPFSAVYEMYFWR